MARVSFDCKLSLKATLDTRDRIKEKHDYMIVVQLVALNRHLTFAEAL